MSHKIQVTPSGLTFEADESDNLLNSALNAGLNFPYGCRNGFCGACRGKLVEGDISYPEEFKPNGLSVEQREQGFILCCKAQPTSNVTLDIKVIEETKELEVKKVDVKVKEINRVADDVIQLMLEQPEDNVIQFMAGQYLDFILEGEKPRAFSIANAPHNEDLIELHIRHVEGGVFTGRLFNDMKVGDELTIEGPLGSFYLREDSKKPILLVGGGTGFAPLKGMIEHAIEAGITRPIHLYHGVREEKDLYMNELAQSWADGHDHIQYTPVLSDQDWDGRTGFVHDAVVADYPEMADYAVYMAGPPVMVNAAKAAFTEAGLKEDELFYDSFEIAAASK